MGFKLTLDYSVFAEFRILGILKIVTLVLGMITLGLTADCYMAMLQEAIETSYLSIVAIALILSLLSILLSVFGIIKTSKEGGRKTDLMLHIVAGLFLISCSICWLARLTAYMTDHGNTVIFSHMAGLSDRGHANVAVQEEVLEDGGLIITERVCAGLFGFINGGLYLAAGVLIWK